MRLRVVRWDTQIEGSMTGANLEVYSMHESSESRIEFVYIMWYLTLDDRCCKLIVMC